MVVLTILVVLSTVVLTTSSGMVNKTRDEMTKRVLSDIREAVIGPSGYRDPDGVPVAFGFLNDLGRPPRAAADEPEPGGQIYTLRELWENVHATAAYEARAATAAYVDDAAQEDPQVILATGWRGPYLRSSFPDGELKDGWGSALVSPNGVLEDYPNALLRTVANAPVTAAGQEIGQVDSPGANPSGRPSETGYDMDLNAYIPAETLATIPVIIEVRNADGTQATPVGTDQIVVRLFGPNPATGLIKVQHHEEDFTADTFSITFSTTPGERVLRAYYDTGKDGSVESKSAIAHAILRTGTNTPRLIVLTIP
jgi:type II secretory pathway pseudopilin PulG